MPISERSRRRFILFKLVVAGLCLLPAARLAAGALGGNLGIDPVETLAIATGQAAVSLLLVTLSITPLRRLSGWNSLIRLRRMLGLFAFFYAVLHVTTYVIFDQEGSLRLIVEDVVKHPWVLIGFLALLLLVPLALTSTRGWVRRLGGRRWQRLHRLVYPAAVSAVLHFLLAVKLDVRKPVAYACMLAVVLGARYAFRLGNAPNRADKPATVAGRPTTAC